MNDRQLRALVAVGTSGSINRAAGQMYISVPALKKQIDMLEKELGTALLYRTNQGVSLTPAGEEFIAYARRAVSELDEVTEKLHEMQDSEKLRIRIGYDNSYVQDTIFYYAVAAFREQVQNIKISTVKVSSFDGKKIDLFFGANYTEAGDIMMHYLCSLPITCLVPRNHPLSKKNELMLAEIQMENLLCPPREMLAIGAPGLLAVLGDEAEYIHLNEHSGQYIQRSILQGGIGIVIGFEEHVNENLVQLPLKDYAFRYRIYSVGAEKKPSLRQFIDFLKEYYPKKCAELCMQLSLNV